MKKMVTLIKTFRRAAYLEGEGIGTWYAYLSKSRIYQKIKKEVSSILIDGLPEKYSLGMDALFWGKTRPVFAYDKRVNKIKEARKIAVQLSHKNIKFSSKKRKMPVDLLTNTDVLQNFSNRELKKYLENSYDRAKKYLLFVMPNKGCYAHPKISHYQTKSLKEMTRLIDKKRVKIIDQGYLDIPLWPAGINLPSRAKRENSLFSLLTLFLVPPLVILEVFYPLWLKKRLAHAIYLLLKKKDDEDE